MDALKQQLLSSPTAHLWERIGIYPHHGIDIFLPALHSHKSAGIGELLDLLPLIDWCHALKLDCLQLLPLNNSDHDPSPYNPMSTSAINFLLLSLHALPHIDDSRELQAELKTLSQLNKTQRIAYTEVTLHKTRFLQRYCDSFGQTIRGSKAFQTFRAENNWLEPFALFLCLKEHFNNASWQEWPQVYKSPTREDYGRHIETYASKIDFYSTVQFFCYEQLLQVKEYAQKKGVLLKGDIPILVSAESAEVWQHQEYFNMQFAAGAPPDVFYMEGQYWGFPIYRWDVLRRDHFSWWKQRLKYASHFFDLFRIDHVIGFFRIWAIPRHAPASQGHYFPQNEAEWETQGRELLHMILSYSEGMMPIAEDLGTIPDALPVCLKEMGICGTKVMRWERNWKGDLHYIPLSHYPPLSLTCVSTHDSETLSQWWHNQPGEAKILAASKQWHYENTLTFAQRYEILWDSHHTPSLFHINLLQEYLALFPELVWPNRDDERINIPGTVLPTNWAYRYRPSVEEIVSHEGLKLQMEKILFSPSPLL